MDNSCCGTGQTKRNGCLWKLLFWNSISLHQHIVESTLTCHLFSWFFTNISINSLFIIPHWYHLPAHCSVTWGWMISSKSSSPRRISSRSGRSPCNTACMSAAVLTGCPFTFTMTSPSSMPPLKHREGKWAAWMWGQTNTLRFHLLFCRRVRYDALH